MTSSEGDRWARGIAAYASQFQVPDADVFGILAASLGEQMAKEAINATGGAWEEDVLTLRDRSLVVVAALAAQGGVEDRLRGHVRWALDHGLTVEELDAALALLAVYVGYPRASTAMEVVGEVVGRPRISGGAE